MCNPAFMAAATVVSGGMRAYGQYKQGVAMRNYYNYLADSERAQGEYEYRMGIKQSHLVQDKAKFEDKLHKRDVAYFAASQQAKLVANGINLNSVTAADLTLDTVSKARLDELAIRYKADSRSWSLKEQAKANRWSRNVQASNYNIAGDRAYSRGKTQAFTTLLGTAASAGQSLHSSGFFGKPAKPGTGGYLKGTPKGAIDMRTWTKVNLK